MSHDHVADPASYSAEEVLRDGGSIHVRAIRPDDRERLLHHFRSLSEQSIYYRFFGIKRALTDPELEELTHLDFDRQVGIVATLRENGEERFIGVARYVRGSEPARAEVAFAVIDEHQGRGIGTLLLEHLSRIARSAGIVEFEADVLGDNNRMLEVFAKSGFKVRRSAQSGVIHVTFPTEETEEFAQASHDRDRRATAQSLASVLRPRSVAVIGASRHSRKIGGAMVGNLKDYGFKGPIYPVNRTAVEVRGLKCYPSVTAIGAPIDLAVIAVPAEAVEAEISACAQAGVHAVVVITSGFAEVSESGRALEERLFELVRGSGMRMVGPNCMGVCNTDPAVRLNATFAPMEPPFGRLAMFTQSGALGIAILDHARARNLGISTFVSGGNRADVSNNDLVAYWADDPSTAVILLYLESVGNPARFARLAREVALTKPIVAVKSGRSAAGTRAATSHSGSLANYDLAVDALFEQAGVIRTNTLEELFDVAALLATQPVPAGARVGVVSNAGGPGILLADACEAGGLELPALRSTTLDHLRTFLTGRSAFANPIDMTASAAPADFERAVAAVGNDPNVDSLVVVYIPPIITRAADTAAAIARAAGIVPPTKPILTVVLSSQPPPAELHTGPRGKLPVYDFPEDAAIALGAAWRYGRWRNRPRGRVHSLGRFAHETIRAVVERVLEGSDGLRWVEPGDLATVMRAAGIRVAQAERTTVEAAPGMAETLGGPLVIKAVAPGVERKRDSGGVIMGLKSPDAVAAAVETLRERMDAVGAHLDGVMLQRQIEGGIEAMVGVTSDPTFGPLVVCSVGGAMSELLKDASFRLNPVTDVDAEEMVNSLRTSPLLDGYRGAPPADREALTVLLMRVSALVEALPELAELELNPIKVLAPGEGAVVIDARMLLRPYRGAAAAKGNAAEDAPQAPR
ncbi:MAG: GNAT family N-acetyltransferase [Candidatus Binataceae bacterium]